jgi:hypothetical protein
LFGAKFPQSSLILLRSSLVGKILTYAKYAAVLERVCYCCTRLSICTFEVFVSGRMKIYFHSVPLFCKVKFWQMVKNGYLCLLNSETKTKIEDKK